ncbi:MAG: DUF5696 domain-containing protein [Kiritimatiellae bacterium]|nr:DUF5696 domain-containing protein [Kiritimatiellia bacterium]
MLPDFATAKTGEDGYFVMPNAFYLSVRAKAGLYTLSSTFTLDQFGMYDDIAIDFHMLSGDDANYSGIARTYRKYQLDRKACIPLKERIKQSPELEYCMNSVEIRVRQGWKPAPSPVEEQTLETEPPMKVVTTFDRVGDIVDSLKKAGVEKVQICLVGWNRKGHDGRYQSIMVLFSPIHLQRPPTIRSRRILLGLSWPGYSAPWHLVHMPTISWSLKHL